MVDTQMLRANNKPEALNAMIERNVLRRIGKADEISAVVAFLATHDAGFLTGETAHVNGGQRLDRQKLHGGIKAAQQHQTFSAGSGCPLVYCKVADVWPGSGAESTPIRTS